MGSPGPAAPKGEYTKPASTHEANREFSREVDSPDKFLLFTVTSTGAAAWERCCHYCYS